MELDDEDKIEGAGGSDEEQSAKDGEEEEEYLSYLSTRED